MMKNIKIAVAYHKKSPLIQNEVYIPIQVGSSLNPTLDLKIQPDNTGDSISEKNDYYCELTALYWVWKNIKAEYKGLCHYRRFFSDKYSLKYNLYNLFKIGQSLRSHSFCNTPYVCYEDCNKFKTDAIKTLHAIDMLLDKYAIICPKKYVENRGSYWHFVVYGIEIMEIIRDVIKSDFPDYFDIIKYKENHSALYFGNMSIMRNDLFEEYCDFLFGVLFKVEQILVNEGWYMDLHKEKVFARKLGFFGEYLTDIFIKRKQYEKVDIKELYLAFLK